MSRQQWGHGYHKGLEDAAKASSDKRWGMAFNGKGECVNCFRTLKAFPDGTLVIEQWSYFDMLMFYNSGSKAQETDAEIDVDSVTEYNPDSKGEKVAFFHTFVSMMAEWARQQKETFGSVSPFESVIQICGKESK